MNKAVLPSALLSKARRYLKRLKEWGEGGVRKSPATRRVVRGVLHWLGAIFRCNSSGLAPFCCAIFGATGELQRFLLWLLPLLSRLSSSGAEWVASPQALSSEASKAGVVPVGVVPSVPLCPEDLGWREAMASGQKRSTGRTVCTLAFLAFCWPLSGLLASSIGCKILRRALMNQLLTCKRVRLVCAAICLFSSSVG